MKIKLKCNKMKYTETKLNKMNYELKKKKIKLK